MQGGLASPNSVIELLPSLVICYTTKLLSYYKPIRGDTMITDYQEDECTELAPESISFYSARMTGTGVAECKDCDFKSVYWECACDLFHDCNDN